MNNEFITLVSVIVTLTIFTVFLGSIFNEYLKRK